MENKKVTVKLFYRVFIYRVLRIVMFWRKKHYTYKITKTLSSFSQNSIEKIFICGIHIFSLYRVDNYTAFCFLFFPILIFLHKYNCYEIAFLGIRVYKKKLRIKDYKYEYSRYFTNEDVHVSQGEIPFNNSTEQNIAHNDNIKKNFDDQMQRLSKKELLIYRILNND